MKRFGAAQDHHEDIRLHFWSILMMMVQVHVSCYICLMTGQYDDTLEWPFQGKVTMELLNQMEGVNHIKQYTMPFNKSVYQKNVRKE